MFVSVLLYLLVFTITNVLWPQSMEYELFSIINQLALPFLSCMWLNGSIQEWIEDGGQEMLFFYSNTLLLKQIGNILSFHLLLFGVYYISHLYGRETWENLLMECMVCFLFQAIYSLGMLMFRSSTLILFVIALLEGWNVFAYFQGVTKGFYLFLNTPAIVTESVMKRYLSFFICGIIIWCVHCLVYLVRKREGKLCG